MRLGGDDHKVSLALPEVSAGYDRLPFEAFHVVVRVAHELKSQLRGRTGETLARGVGPENDDAGLVFIALEPSTDVFEYELPVVVERDVAPVELLRVLFDFADDLFVVELAVISVEVTSMSRSLSRSIPVGRRLATVVRISAALSSWQKSSKVQASFNNLATGKESSSALFEGAQRSRK